MNTFTCSGEDIIKVVAYNLGDYSWVDPLYLGIPSKHIEKEWEIDVLFEVGSSSYKISTVPTNKKECHAFEGCSTPFYSCIFYKLRVELPLIASEKGVLDHLRIPTLQLHPSAWTFVRVFQYWHECYGKVDSATVNLFFHHLKINPLSRSKGSGLIFMHV